MFAGSAGLGPEAEVNWRDGDETRRLYAGLVTDDYFETLGIPFLVGRGIARGETATVVLSHHLWRSRFNENPDVLGRRLVLDGRAYSVAGVLPADHRTVVGFGFSPDIYVPARRDDDLVQREIGLRVALGATPAQVLRLVCRQSLTLVGVGVTCGLALALFATRPLAMFLSPGSALPTLRPFLPSWARSA